jgi:AbrB family looped-hinge helix DNA binding protein
MVDVEFTRASSKGQVVIPQDIREELGIKEGTPFAIAVQDRTIVLKKIELPKMSWKEATKPFRTAATKSNFTKEDLNNLIAEVRVAKR